VIMTDQSRKVETGRVPLCTNSLLMLLEPCQGGKAERVVGDVAKHQAVPGSGLVEPAQLFAESSQLVVELRMRCHTERLGGQGLGVDRSHLLEGGLVGREQLVDPMEVGSLPHGPEGHPEAVKHDPVMGLEGMGAVIGRDGSRPITGALRHGSLMLGKPRVGAVPSAWGSRANSRPSRSGWKPSSRPVSQPSQAWAESGCCCKTVRSTSIPFSDWLS
jgi:hypothetical protein